MARIKHIHRKTSKGKRYTYFDTGVKSATGKPILKPIVDERDPGFWRAYAAACNAREKRKTTVESMTFDGLMRLYEKSPEFRQLAPNSQRSYLHSLNKVAALLRDDEGRSPPIEGFDDSDVLLIRDTLAEGQGANQAVRSIGALFAWAMKVGRRYVKSNPANGVELLEEGEHEPWPEWLVEAALDDPMVRPEVALLYFTGQRIGDVVKMQWTDIRGGKMEVCQQKTKDALSVAMLPELTTILEGVPRQGFTILTNAEGNAWTTSGLRQRIQAWAKTKGQKIVPHGLRKNAVNALLHAGCSTAEVNAITGQDLQTIEHYAKRRDRSQLGSAAVLKLEIERNKRRT